MKINQKILSIPPYISTSWKNIASLHVEPQGEMLFLVVTLLNGVAIEIPDLPGDLIEMIFVQHAKFLEMGERPSKTPARHPMHLALPQEQVFSFEFPLKDALGSIENLGTLLQHNPDQKDAPELPPELLMRIAEMAKTMDIDDPNHAPKPEPFCHCIHCQITGALNKGITENSEEPALPELEEIVSDDELKFRLWDISQIGDKLFLVTNASDKEEHYTVFLGNPGGCTCGEKQCKHIRAVLES